MFNSKILSLLLLLLLPSVSMALTCGTNQIINSAGTACECLASFYPAKNGLSCVTAQELASSANTDMRTRFNGYSITNELNTTVDPSASVELTSTYGASNTGNIGLNTFGSAKQTECSNYVPNPAAPNPRKDAECLAVVELSKNQTSGYISRTGFNKNDAAFGSSAYRTAASDPLSVVPTLNSSASGSCTTVTKYTDPIYRTGQCVKAASPNAVQCTQQVIPTVKVEKFCNATGTGVSRGFYSYKTSSVGLALHDGVSDSSYSISYSCTPPDANGESSSIVATVNVTTGGYSGGCNCPFAYNPINITFTPGVSTQPISAQVACDGSWGGMLGGCTVSGLYATVWYDGTTDTVYVQGQPGNSTNYSNIGSVASCPLGQIFHASNVGSYSISTKNNSTTFWYEKSPAYCGATNPSPSIVATPSISKIVTTGGDLQTTVYSCPAGTLSWSSSGTGLSCAYVTCATGYTIFDSGHGDFACYLPPVSILNYAPFDKYSGGAGIRSRLIDSTVSSTPACGALQSNTANTGSSGVSYPATQNTVYNCASGWNLSGSAAPYSCNFQPPPYAATVTTSYACPSGTLIGTNCSVQPATYTAFSTDIYSCNAGDSITSGTCANGGTKSGETCGYKSVPATTSYTCDIGLTLNGALCYTNAALANTLTVADNLHSFNPKTTTYSCDVLHTLSGTQCIPNAQQVTCDHQRPSISAIEIMHYKCMPTMSGNFAITYATPSVDTNLVNLCISNQITKPSNLQSITCPANYTWNATANQCEYQMPDYTASQTTDCYTANFGNTGTAYVLSNGICSKTTTYTAY